MTKRVRAKHKIDRRLGENIWGRPKSPLNRRESRSGQHGERRAWRKLSDFGQQLKAKQKLKGYYASISERQFRKIYDEASRAKGSTSEHIIGLLERRLDALVYRAKFVPTVLPHASSSVTAMSWGERPARDHSLLSRPHRRRRRGPREGASWRWCLKRSKAASAMCPTTSMPTTTR